jgi:FMN-dependent oxidoreductase (nitrilotriacetate monooxygenase family)
MEIEMSETANHMNLVLFIEGTGLHVGGWRAPDAVLGPEDFSVISKCAGIAERAKFDMVFFADAPISFPGAGYVLRFDALAAIASLAPITKHIGLGATVSTTYTQPYNMARMLSSIDHISGGRVGWNVVTTSNPETAHNFGLPEHAPKADRYEMAAEFVHVVKSLWDSWEDDAVLNDKATGQVVNTRKRHAPNHKGKYFSVRGELNSSRPPQGYPVTIQAGASEIGLPFAAATGEVIFAVQASIESAKTFRTRMREFAAQAGRDPNGIRILVGICPFIAESEEKAREMLWGLSKFIDVEAAWAKLGLRMGIDLTGLDPEGPVPTIPWDEMRGHAKALTEVANKYNFNLRELRDFAAASAGHHVVFGTPEMIADELEHWFREGAADGFMILPPYIYGPLEAFADQVVPLLQKRGLFRTDYTGRTLRENLGLPRPPHPMALKQAAE